MAKEPVWKKNAAGVYEPLWIERGAAGQETIEPAWAEDACETACCPPVSCSVCPQATILAVAQGVNNGGQPNSACVQCSDLDGAFVLTPELPSECTWAYKDEVSVTCFGSSQFWLRVIRCTINRVPANPALIRIAGSYVLNLKGSGVPGFPLVQMSLFGGAAVSDIPCPTLIAPGIGTGGTFGSSPYCGALGGTMTFN